MSSAPRLQQRRRGPYNDLLLAAEDGSAERVLALLSSGSTDIDQQGPYGRTPLMFAAYGGYSRVVRILLNKGANVSIGEDEHLATALHISAHKGHLLVTNMLIEAGENSTQELLLQAPHRFIWLRKMATQRWLKH